MTFWGVLDPHDVLPSRPISKKEPPTSLKMKLKPPQQNASENGYLAVGILNCSIPYILNR